MSWEVALDKAIDIWKDRAVGKRRKKACPLCEEKNFHYPGVYCIWVCPLAKQMKAHCGGLYWNWDLARGKKRLALAKRMLVQLRKAKRNLKTRRKK